VCRLQPAIRICLLELVVCLQCLPRPHPCEFVCLFCVCMPLLNFLSHVNLLLTLCSGSPVFWIGVGVALSVVFSMVQIPFTVMLFYSVIMNVMFIT
jgi:hypothetical protein